MAGLIKRIASLKCPTLDLMSLKHHLRMQRALCTTSTYHGIYSGPTSHHHSLRPKSCILNFQRKYGNSPQVIPFKLSDIGEGIREVSIKEWFIKVGDKVSQFDNICEVQSDKASVTITSRYDGIITKLYYNVDDVALVGDPLVDLEVLDHCSNLENVNSTDEVESRDLHTSPKDKILATPAVRRFAQEEKVDLQKVSGTGKHGRILKEDVLKYVEDANKNVTSHHLVKENLARDLRTSVDFSEKEVQIKPINGFAKAMVKTMTVANTIPHFVYSDEINVSKISKIIEELKKDQMPVKFTYMPFFIKALSKCLVKYPILNSSVDENCENIIYKSHHNIGVAMDTSAGLVVPNIKHVEHLNILDIAMELSRLHADGLAGALRPSDLGGGTFTLSNIGTIGGTYTKPIILPPEVAICAIGTVQILPRYDITGNLVKSKIMCISWAADHRIIDGATMSRFSNMWKNYIQNPYKLLLNI